MEERLEAGAEIVEARLAVGGVDEPVLGAAAVAGEAHIALETVARELGELVVAEAALLCTLRPI